MTKKLSFLLLFLCLSLISRAQYSTSTTDVFILPSSVRATAMGGENVSVVDDEAGLGMHNPALLTNVSHNTLGLSFMSYASGSMQMGAQFAREFGERHTGAVYANFMKHGSQTETDVLGTVIGDFTPKDIVLGAGYSYLFNDRWSGGANLKFGYSRLADFNAFSLAVDAGLNYYDPDKNFSFGIVARNIGAQIAHYDERPERVPFSLQTGFTKSLGYSPVRFSFTLVDLTRWSRYQYYTTRENGRVSVATDMLNHAVLGIDIVPHSGTFWLSLGYNFRRAYELKAAGSSAFAGITAGGGIHVKRFSMGLSYARYHRAWSSIMGNIGYSI